MALPLVARDAALPEGGWRVTWLSDLDAAVLADDAGRRAALPDGGADGPEGAAAAAPHLVRHGLVAALQPLLKTRWDGPFRGHIDAGVAELGAVVDPATHVVWLGSPRFEFERRLVALARPAAGRESATPDDELAAVAAPFAGAWTSASEGPLDIAVATATHGLTDLTGTLGPSPRQIPLEAVHTETRALGQRLHRGLGRYRPGLLERVSQWGLALQADYAVLRVHALRFVALLPSLDHDTRGGEVQRLLVEMLRRTRRDSRQARSTGSHRPLPPWLELVFSVGLVLASLLPAPWVAAATRWGVRRLAGIFIAGESIESAAPTLAALRRSGRGATVDQLGEAVLSEGEADAYRDEVLDNVRGVAHQFGAERNSAGIPLAHVSVKVSALSARYDADDPEGTWACAGPRLLAILRLAHDLGVFVHVDAEHYAVRDLTWTLLERALRSDPALWTWRDVGIVVQAYLRDAPAHLAEVIRVGHERGVVMPLRLVKGAYWDAETTEADAHGYDAPQWLNKEETDLCFQQLVVEVLANGAAVQLCIGSHNLRDHCFARAVRRHAFPKAPEVEHQALHATYEALSTAMAAEGWAVRNYIPVGSLLVGMAYLVRRIMENSSQVGVLTMARGGVPLDVALSPPGQDMGALERDARRRPNVRGDDPRRGQLSALAGARVLDAAGWPFFRNLGPSRLHRPPHRAGLQAAIADDLLVGWSGARAERDDTPAPVSGPGAPQRSGPTLWSVSPSTGERLAGVATATEPDVAAAVARAEAAQPAWAARTDRPALLLRAAERMAAARDHWAVLVAREAGKGRREALGDVDEAVDFLRFYAEEAARRALGPRPRGPRGVMAVVAPWNFPLAIPCGMTAAALAAGCSALLKSAEETPLVAEAFVTLLHTVGVPRAAAQHLPGDGPSVGAPLVRADAVAGVVFTGSKAVGTLLHGQLAAAAHRPRRADDATTDAVARPVGKVVVTEMGGKNAVIITANADLDEATGACVHAAFDHAGQKCSAASRLLVDRRVFEPFSERLARAAADLVVGPALAATTQVNPVISSVEAERLRAAQHAAAAEAERRDGQALLVGPRDVSAHGAGAQPTPASDVTLGAAEGSPASPGPTSCLVAPAVFRLPADAHRDPSSYARRELFGPVVHVLPFDTLNEAVEQFNHTEYALTGGLFAQSEDDIDALRSRLNCGNLYVNRSNTGARVGVEPFGGFGMSGTGPKAGDRGYLDAFLAAEGEGPPASTNALPVPADATLAGLPVWPLATGPAPPDRALAATLASALAAAHRPCHDTLEALARELGTPADAPEPTLPIPGQSTVNHRTLARGHTLILAARANPGATGLAHLVAALSVGAPTLVVAPTAAHEEWVPVIKAARAAGVAPDRLELVAAAAAGEAAAWASLPALATLVVDGPRGPWSALLSEALQRRESPTQLAKVWCAHDGPALTDPQALVAAHQVVRTVAVNTMRHGAPLTLDAG